MQKIYTTKMINTGGRSGEVHSPDNSFELKIAAPGSHVADTTITAQVSLYAETPTSYVIGVVLEGHIEGLSLEETQELLDIAHTVCPYSKATAGNIDVVIKAV